MPRGRGGRRAGGWLDDPAVLLSLGPRARDLAVASAARSVLGIVPVAGGGGVTVKPALGPDDGRISAVEWVPLDAEGAQGEEGMALVVGTDAGWLLFYSLAGDLLHKQSIYPAKILKLNFSERKENAWEDSGSDELSVVFPGVIARCDGADLQIMLQKSFQEVKSRMWKDKFEQEDDEDTSSFEKIPLQIWNSSQRHYCAITVGEDAVVSAYRLSEDRSRSLVGAILSRGVAATFSTISSLSKILWRSEPSPTKKSRPKPQAFAKTSPLTCLKDSPRKGERLTLSPSGTLAAITDSLGRILLLDTRALVAVRLWKGYRDASCLFVEMLRNKDKSSSSSMHLDYTKSDYCLCLAIHAPRKGIIEVWQMRTGPRLLTIPCPKGSRILQPSTRFSSSSAFSSYTPLEVYLFNGDSGQLSVLNRHIG
uniref:Rab3 GTPase-activating protein non-catalytic subunit n=1 Tax=Aegilops tauschii TaxID=37682 RepID=M8CQ45_AEGTA